MCYEQPPNVLAVLLGPTRVAGAQIGLHRDGVAARHRCCTTITCMCGGMRWLWALLCTGTKGCGGLSSYQTCPPITPCIHVENIPMHVSVCTCQWVAAGPEPPPKTRRAPCRLNKNTIKDYQNHLHFHI